jgi:hypothetical protein
MLALPFCSIAHADDAIMALRLVFIVAEREMIHMSTKERSPLSSDPNSKDERDQHLAIKFKSSESVWLVNEQYDTSKEMWKVDMVRLGKAGQWVRQRYTYEIVTKVVYFYGEIPVTTTEFSSLRRTGKLFRAHQNPRVL